MTKNFSTVQLSGKNTFENYHFWTCTQPTETVKWCIFTLQNFGRSILISWGWLAFRWKIWGAMCFCLESLSLHLTLFVIYAHHFFRSILVIVIHNYFFVIGANMLIYIGLIYRVIKLQIIALPSAFWYLPIL